MTKKEIKNKFNYQKKKLITTYKNEKRSLKEEYNKELDVYFTDNGITKQNPPRRTVLEEIGNSITHGLGTCFAIVAYILMLIASKNMKEYLAATMYFLGLFLMFTNSCLYHSFSYGSKVKRVFRRFDYASIYLLIGSTFAPILLCYIGGVYGIIFFIIQWLIIILGIILIAVFGPNKLKFIHFPLYLLLGWSGLLFLPTLLANDFGFFLWILIGGVIYTLGVIPFAIDRKVCHFIWHFFVFFGAVIQWIGIYIYIYLG